MGLSIEGKIQLMQPRKLLNSILVKPAGAECNIACVYCFYLEKAGLYPSVRHPRMPDDVLEALIRQMMTEGAQNVSIGWQGGEPTLMGLDFFRRAVALQQQYGRSGQTVGNGLQTNGLLIDESWAEFFNEYQFLVGLSIDGPAHVHDHYRITRNGKPTYDLVRKKGDLMLEKGVAVNALSVVNDYSANHGREIYEHHKAMGFEYMQFIPCIEPAPHGGIAAYSVTPELYGKLLCDIFDRWLGDFKDGYPTTSIRDFDSWFHTYVGLPAPQCTLMAECGAYVCVEHNGDVYSCDFYVDDSWKLGNVLSDTLSGMLNSERQTQFGRLKRQLHEQCRSCEWLNRCYGNCPKEHEIGGRKADDLNYFCKSYMQFFEHADPVFKEVAERWKDRERRRRVREMIPAEVFARTGRNDLCPCGSGKKYKHCCGE